MTDLFIKRPIMTTLVMFAIIFAGLFAYRLLPVSDLPTVDYPTINVNARLPGASPETMASAVAMPLEKNFSTIAGVTQMTSSSSLGGTSITLQFDLSRNIDSAAQDVNTKIVQSTRELPQNMPFPPTYSKVNPADQPVLFISLSSETMKLSDVDDYAENVLAQRLSTIEGVAQVDVQGPQKFAVRVQLDPRMMATRGVGINDVQQAIQQGNVNQAVGTLWGANQTYTLQANGQLRNAEQFRPLIVSYKNGSPVRLGDVANVIDSVENTRSASWLMTPNHGLARSIMLSIQRQPGTNTVEVVDAVRAVLPELEKQLPAALNMEQVFDRSVSIRDSVHDVKFTLYLALVLVIMVIFLFLRNVWATIIPSLALPFSLVATFAVMYVLDYSLDNLSLMAVTLAVGFVVDDAIVMLENIVRHLEMGEAPMQAAIRGAREIGFTIVSMTLSLAAVFLPVLFMGGIIGRLLHEFAVTISVAILVSGFVSLTLTPMLCSRVLRPHKEQHHGKMFMATERVFDWVLGGYERTLKIAMRHSAITMIVAGLVAASTIFLFMKVPTGFLPTEDQGQIFGTTEAAQGTAFEAMRDKQLTVANAILQSNDAKYIQSMSVSVAGRGGASNGGQVQLRFIDRSQRPAAEQIMQDLRPVVAKIPGVNTYFQLPTSIRIGGFQSKSQYQYTLQGPDTDELYAAAANLEAQLQKSSLLQDVTTDMQLKNPQVTVDIDRDKAASMGVNVQQIETAMGTAYGTAQISTIYSPNTTYRVVLEVLPQFQDDPSALSSLYIRSNTGTLVRLDNLAKITRTLGPMSINHLGQTPAVTVSFNIRPGVSLGDATAEVDRVARQVLPSSISTSFQGTAQAFQASFKGLGMLLLAAIAVIYIVLGILYESFIHPITILSGLPSAGVGALLTLMIFHKDLNLYSFVGIIMLIGIVKKNAIMMIDFALESQRNGGLRPEDAIFQGALVRFRPIMMTTMAALMGTLPIALGYGAGGESRQPLGLAVVGGLMFSQLITLYLTPVFYVYMERLQGFFRRGKKHPEFAGRTEEKKLAEPVYAAD